MATDKYGLVTVDFGTTGWNGILKTSIEQIDAYMQTYARFKVGPAASIAPYKPVCLQDGVWELAKEGTNQMPVVGISIEPSTKTSGEYLRAQRAGLVTNTDWSWNPPSGEIWCNSDGDLVQNISGEEWMTRQARVGCVHSATKIFVQL